MQLKRTSIEFGTLEQLFEGNMSIAASQQDIEQDTQSFLSKDDLKNKFKPFKKERNSIGKLIQRAKSNETTSRFQFLKSQQVVVKPTTKKQVRNNHPIYKWSTTNLLGLQKRDITTQDQEVSLRQRLKYFKINLQADQGFIKQFREYKKQFTPATIQTRAFLTPKREYFYKDSLIPGPGVYSGKLMLTDPGSSIEYSKSPQTSKQQTPICQKDFYDFQLQKKNENTPDFFRTISRERAYQRSIFAQIEIQKKENKKLQKEQPYDQKKIEQEIEYLLYQQQKYGKINYQRILDNNDDIKKMTKPDTLDNTWSKMLERYGFKKIKGGKIVKERVQTLQNE
ncbi:unnamed protein product [Paramecium primaurelia]|uniref:Uncharacterized protein n=1 Tax=Paramecium primaurelia TaxID=5886 RepID=A0A8S1PK57_PARPR|nr:unnamed protein product [Paramecium primaurelia]